MDYMDDMTSFVSLMHDYLMGIQECKPIKILQPLLPFIPEVPIVSGQDTDPLLCVKCLCPLFEPVSLLTGQSVCRHCYAQNIKERCEVAYCVNVCLAGVVETHISGTYRAMQLRLQGNDMAREKQWEEAIETYSKSLQLLEGGPGEHIVLSNRSLAEVSSGMLEEALRDANRCVQRAPYWMKGYYRRAAVLEKMGYKEEALVMCLMMAKSGTKDTLVEQCITRLGKDLVAKGEDEGMKMVCERIWQHVCVEREKVARVGHIFKWQRLKILSLKAEEVECSLCCRLYYRPTTTPCGHTLCEPCLNRCLDHNTICPVCRSPLTLMLGKYQHKPCVALETILKECLPEASSEREREHRAEQGALVNLTEILSTDGYEDTFDLSVFVCCLAFPFVHCSLHIFEPRYRLMIRQAWESESKCFGMCVPLGDTFYQCGTVLKINDHQILEDGRVLINTIGVRRFLVLSHFKRDGYTVARVCLISDTERHIVSESTSVAMRTALAYGVTSETVKEMLGTIPEHSEGEGGPDGSGWIWYGLALVHLRGIEISPEVLSGTSAMSRYRQLLSYSGIRDS